ncbi:hypothetical protein Glove_521g36 [Diversispora epigaea]|uniref:Uncharacterized protein n=1 Tax=Diversispora epigaea TaxID=1348612 RepID=A0A397GH00_9GLOM|nr:hypothetical protein Glove_521g36 [Diversispora epigaea]
MESFETIKIIMDYQDPWIFNADCLRKFFEGWCCKGGRGDKKFRRLRIEPIWQTGGTRLSFHNLKKLYPWIFNADCLRKFFEGWCCKGGRGDKKFRRLRIEPIWQTGGTRLSFHNLKKLCNSI